ncbi:hypothetical protein SDC9_199197 [bioreactor metagenome]|uniref:Uncharacterized protein n=1 Tax=bioreactor metagenome TaxID=1076179 RepID=A0A645IM58_9ZZZZ
MRRDHRGKLLRPPAPCGDVPRQRLYRRRGHRRNPEHPGRAIEAARGFLRRIGLAKGRPGVLALQELATGKTRQDATAIHEKTRAKFLTGARPQRRDCAVAVRDGDDFPAVADLATAALTQHIPRTLIPRRRLENDAADRIT